MSWFGLDTALFDVVPLFLGAMALLELVVEGPGIAEVGIKLDSAVEPVAGLLDFALTPEQLGDGEENL